MYTFLKNAKAREALGTELPSAVASMVIAELFYKFHSFSLECISFLATWLALSWLFARVRGFLPARRRAASDLKLDA